MSEVVARVHVVAKTHLDLGFTALASEVRDRYLEDFFPRAMATATELRHRGGPERLVWTTGSWILDQALGDGDEQRAASVADAVTAGDLAWHAWPVTTHTELLDPALARSGLAISAALDARFGRVTTAAKMTDVPGHTRGLVSLLAEAGVTFLHIGVNPAWPVPDVPPVFRWRAPDGAEVTVAYQPGGYGGEVVVPGCGDALAFVHTGDNLGPPAASEVIEAFAHLRTRFEGAEICASTLDGFARALARDAPELPVVTDEIGDPWLFGAGSDPQKLAAYRHHLRGERSAELDRRLLLVAEHTWGLDQKVALPGDRRWARSELDDVRASAAGRRFEASWAEQRAYLPGLRAQPEAWVPGSDHRPLAVGDEVSVGGWLASLGDAGELVAATTPTGRAVAEADRPLGLVRYQTFDEDDYARYFAQLTPAEHDREWAEWDNTKPGIDAAGARSGLWSPSVVGAWVGLDGELVAEVTFADDLVHRFGAPATVWLRWRFGPTTAMVRIHWVAKAASRLPEALWCSFVPPVHEPARWQMEKLGQTVSPLDVVRRGGRSLHAVGAGLTYDGPDGSLRIATPDAPLVAPGAPNLLDADPPLPDLAGGFHVLLHDNLWGTNFPMWSEGPASFAMAVDAGR